MSSGSVRRQHPLRELLLTAVLVVAVLYYLPGCSSFRPAPQLVTADEKEQLPPQVKVWLGKLEEEGERNAVLNMTELAATAIENREEVPPALLAQVVDRPLDEAIQRIETVYADTPEARKARSLWHAESSKDFKGEPYERAFVYLLRGLRYYEEGDFDNARACFKSGILQDSLSEEGEFNADMASFEYLTALCSLKTGDREAAREALQRARALCPDIHAPRADSNLLVVFFVGNAPLKERIGEYEEILLLVDGRTATEAIHVCAPWYGELARFSPVARTDDMGYQARTRGGRQVDQINARKATAKSAAEKTAKVAAISGVTLLGVDQFDDFGQAARTSRGAGSSANTGTPAVLIVVAALIVIAVVVTVVAHAIKTKADIRRITSVPGHIYLWDGRVVPGRQAILARICGGSEEVRLLEVQVPYDNDHVVAYVYCP